MRINPSHRLSPRDEPFSPVQVSAGSAVEPHWREFGKALAADAFDPRPGEDRPPAAETTSHLRAAGFHPLEIEVERLHAVETHPAVHYYAALVGSKKFSLPGRGPCDSEFYGRTSSAAALGMLGCECPTTYCDLTGDGALTDWHVELDKFFPRTHPMPADFLKEFRERLAPLGDVELCRDLLRPWLPDGHEVTCRQYMALFDQSVEAVYSGN